MTRCVTSSCYQLRGRMRRWQSSSSAAFCCWCWRRSKRKTHQPTQWRAAVAGWHGGPVLYPDYQPEPAVAQRDGRRRVVSKLPARAPRRLKVDDGFGRILEDYHGGFVGHLYYIATISKSTPPELAVVVQPPCPRQRMRHGRHGTHRFGEREDDEHRDHGELPVRPLC